MSKMRLFMIIVIVLAFTAATALVSGNTLALYLDIASLILVMVVPFIVISLIYPLSEQKAMCGEVLKRTGEADRGLLAQGVEFLTAYRRIALWNALIWTIMGAIAIGAHLEGPEALGLNFGVLMIVPLYTAIFLVSVIEPLRAAGRHKLARV